MENSLFASFTILAACCASMQVLGIGCIPSLLTQEAMSRCVSPLARMISFSPSPLLFPSLTVSQTTRVPASPHHDSHRFLALVSLLSPWNVGSGLGSGSQGHEEGNACETRASVHININARTHCY